MERYFPKGISEGDSILTSDGEKFLPLSTGSKLSIFSHLCPEESYIEAANPLRRMDVEGQIFKFRALRSMENIGY